MPTAPAASEPDVMDAAHDPRNAASESVLLHVDMTCEDTLRHGLRMLDVARLQGIEHPEKPVGHPKGRSSLSDSESLARRSPVG